MCKTNYKAMYFFAKKKQTNPLFEDESPNKITFKLKRFFFYKCIKNFKFFDAVEAITNRLRPTLPAQHHKRMPNI